MDDIRKFDLNNPEYYINRELSLLAFNQRVLAQAEDARNPLLERLRFLCISSTNLDEFFEIRVAGLKQQLALRTLQTRADNMGTAELLVAISDAAHDLVKAQYHVLNALMIPELAKKQIYFKKRDEWSAEEQGWLRNYFVDQLLPVLSPMGLDPAHPFPQILNKSLNFLVSLEGKDAFGRNSGFAVVQAPRALPRIITLPENITNAPHKFVFLSSIIHAFVDELFPGMKTTGCYQFRLTRNSDLFVDEEEVEDLLLAVEGELFSRRYGDAVRLEVDHQMPEHMSGFLREHFKLTEHDIYPVNGPVNLSRLDAVYDLVDQTELKYFPFTPNTLRLTNNVRFFEALRNKGDILLHHPFDSFLPVVDFLRQAAEDSQVLAIKQTLYRTGPDSPIVSALAAAARAGKEVAVVIELRARFDEEANIALANRLQAAGVHVVYGVVGYKTHAKMILVVRREEDGKLWHYAHLGTGNYHPRTAHFYTDYGLLTANKAMTSDVSKLFRQLTSLGKASKLEKLLQSPFTLHKALLDKIQLEIDAAKAGNKARIIAKMNALVEPQIIRALYEASAAGVKIDLVVRGMCALRPGIPGVSDNIQVRSIIGRFLEHTRVYYFYNGGESTVYCASADWMERNLFRRVEACFPVEEKKLKQKIINDLKLYLKDDSQSWLLQADGQYQRAVSTADEPVIAQQVLMQEAAS